MKCGVGERERWDAEVGGINGRSYRQGDRRAAQPSRRDVSRASPCRVRELSAMVREATRDLGQIWRKTVGIVTEHPNTR